MAPIVVMTTEVLRNMLYVGSDALTGLGYVVMDEVHYLGDRFRGAVWEEVIIHLPDAVRLVSLSATVSNAEEFGDWLVAVRGHTKAIVHEERPVPLWQHMLVGNRMFDLFAGDDEGPSVNPELRSYIRDRMRFADLDGRGARPRGGYPRGRRWRPPHREDVLTRLDREGLLPAITFIFSRAGCEAAVRQCVASGVRLTTDDERTDIQAIVAERTATLAAEDLEVLGYWEWLDALGRGLAAHHAGLIPAFKETVEELFVRGLVRMVFATETLALGINMPARTVVLERLIKFNGEAHADLTAGEYTQLTGRAGRRGIDVEGHAVVLWSPDVDPDQVAGLASTRTYPLHSSFLPSYNMAVNLVGQVGRTDARDLLESSFAQFQADRAVVGLKRHIARNERALVDLRSAMSCHLGDFEHYAQLRYQIKERENALVAQGRSQRRAEVADSLDRLTAGDVIRIPSGRRAGLAVILDPGVSQLSDARPCHGCAEREDHARWAERYLRLRRETDGLRHKAERRTHSLARTFDQVCAMLTERGYLHGDAVTNDGRRLSRIWSESDLLIAEALRGGSWDDLNTAELAGVCSAMVYESRRDEPMAPRLPVGAVREALADTIRLWGEISEREAEYGLPITREPDLGFVWASYRWAAGDSLDAVLSAVAEDGAPFPAGDFVRWMRQVVDLLEQLSRADAVPASIRTTATAAVTALRRGVVAQQL
jgi:ATP-dependent RNA helicase HelY